MDENTRENGTLQIYCFKFPRQELKVWLYCIVPFGFSCLLHLASITTDSILACALISEGCPITAVAMVILLYVPVVAALLLKPPQLPPDVSLTSRFLQLGLCALAYPVLIAVSLVRCFIWTTKSVLDSKPYDEILSGSEAAVPREVHSYLFLQGFLQCAPQAILQMHLLILGEVTGKCTVALQFTSILISLVTVASRTAKYHRYEAQVMGGRSAILLSDPPQPNELSPSNPLLPIRFCLRSKLIGVESDSPLGEVVAFFSWFCLIFGRILTLVISFKNHAAITIIISFTHFSIMLVYLLSSQATTLYDIHSRLVSATFSIIALVEVSVRFHKIPLLYAIFFVLLLVEDTFFMILFFIYPVDKCKPVNLDCKHFGLFSYLILNSHVVGVILFGIYLAKFRPRMKTLISSTSTTSIVTN